MTDDRRTELLDYLQRRREFDDSAATRNFVLSQAFIGTSILASFGSAIVAAADIASPSVVALLAAIPGTAIIIDRSFLFAAKWRWHCAVSTRFTAFEKRLRFEGDTVEEISNASSEFLTDMEERYPTPRAEGLPVTVRHPMEESRASTVHDDVDIASKP